MNTTTETKEREEDLILSFRLNEKRDGGTWSTRVHTESGLTVRETLAAINRLREEWKNMSIRHAKNLGFTDACEAWEEIKNLLAKDVLIKR
ncbi:MAG: hypothetical protein LBG17_00175 [Bacteroidales bacterium]|jgi:hypothetical protein|nr:hypothetical protein [Bacteroidales bacterium]